MQDETTLADIASIAEEHGCNARVDPVGEPPFGIHDWIRLVTATAGGYVGHVRAPGREALYGLVAFVPADVPETARPMHLPSPRFLDAASGAGTTPHLREHLQETAAFLAGLADGNPVLEASYRIGGVSIDLARARHSAADGPAQAGWQEEDRFFAGKDASAQVIAAQKPQQPHGIAGLLGGTALAAAMERRIRASKAEGGFLLSVSDTGKALVVAGECPPGPATLTVTGLALKLETGGHILAATADAPMAVLLALAGRTLVQFVSASRSGPARAETAAVIFC